MLRGCPLCPKPACILHKCPDSHAPHLPVSFLGLALMTSSKWDTAHGDTAARWPAWPGEGAHASLMGVPALNHNLSTSFLKAGYCILMMFCQGLAASCADRHRLRVRPPAEPTRFQTRVDSRRCGGDFVQISGHLGRVPPVSRGPSRGTRVVYFCCVEHWARAGIMEFSREETSCG